MEIDKKPLVAVAIAKQPMREWLKFDVCGYSMMGYSRAAEKTFFYCKELNLALDGGDCRGRQPKICFITHCHSDHSYDIGYLARAAEGVKIYVPKEMVELAEVVIRADININANGRYREEMATYEVVGVESGDSFELPLLKAHRVEVFQCFHAVPCVGFGVSARKKKLKAQYVGMPGAELGKLRKEGVAIEEIFWDKSSGFVFLGDTSIDVFTKEPGILDYGSVIVECSFVWPIPNQMTHEEMLERSAR